MENSTPPLKLPRRMILIIVLIGIIGFFERCICGAVALPALREGDATGRQI